MFSYVLATIALALPWYGRTIYKKLRDPKPLPVMEFDKYWGSGVAQADSETIRSFALDAQLAAVALQERLMDNVQLCEPLDNVGSDYGVNSVGFHKFISYWTEDYLPRWPERQAYLNSLPQFTTQIQGLNIHFIHTKSVEDTTKRVVPILLLHGWPGSVREFYEIIPLIIGRDAILTNVAFSVVVPSLPGYGWSEAAHFPGLSATATAVIMRNLMLKLGYEQFYVQGGGDWGSVIGSAIATVFPQNVIGFHSNMMQQHSALAVVKGYIASIVPSLFVYKQHQDFFFPMKEKLANLLHESGYLHQLATKPDTLGIALSHNPIGLAAYILEKFSTWTNPNSRLQADGGWQGFDASFKDAILDNIMIYFLSNSITSSMRLYAESFSSADEAAIHLAMVPTHVPAACARFKHAMLHTMDWQLRDKYPNLIQSSYFRQGGHFAALENTNILFSDLAEFIRSVNRMKKVNAL